MCETSKKIAAKLRELRTKRGMSQKEVGEALGIKRPNVTRLENGKYCIGIDVIARYAKLLGHELTIVPTDDSQQTVGE